MDHRDPESREIRMIMIDGSVMYRNEMHVPNFSSLFTVVGEKLSSFLLWTLSMLWSPPFLAFSGVLPDFPSTSLTVLSSLQGHLHLLTNNCESFLPFHPLQWSHSHYTSSLWITAMCRWPTDLKLQPIHFSWAPDPVPYYCLAVSSWICQKSLKISMSKSELITSSPHLILFQYFIFQCIDPPFFQLSKLETQDSSLIPSPLLAILFANLCSSFLVFHFCKSAHFFHPYLWCPHLFPWLPVCSTYIYPYFCSVCFPPKADLVTLWLKTWITMVLLLG